MDSSKDLEQDVGICVRLLMDQCQNGKDKQTREKASERLADLFECQENLLPADASADEKVQLWLARGDILKNSVVVGGSEKCLELYEKALIEMQSQQREISIRGENSDRLMLQVGLPCYLISRCNVLHTGAEIIGAFDDWK